MFLLSTLTLNTSNLELIIYEIIVGIGAGLAMPLFTVAVQNAVTKRDLGVATSSSMYFEQLGSVIGLAVLGTIVNMTLKLNLQNTTVNIASPLLVTAIHNVFFIGVILNIIGLVLCFFLKDIYMSNEMEEEIGYENT
jgi:MFS family permease